MVSSVIKTWNYTTIFSYTTICNYTTILLMLIYHLSDFIILEAKVSPVQELTHPVLCFPISLILDEVLLSSSSSVLYLGTRLFQIPTYNDHAISGRSL